MKFDAWGTVLSMGVRQVETAVVVGTITGSGDAHFILTKAGMTGSAITVDVAVLENDTPDTVATKAATAMNLIANITAKCKVEASGPNVIVTALEALADDGTFNLAYDNADCTGLTGDASSTNTTAGVALATVAAVTNLSGPGISLDSEDVTTHESTEAWEEVVVTILRSGELTADLVFDPADDTHDSTGGRGLLHRIGDKTDCFFTITFPDTAGTIWSFPAFVTGFEPGAPVDGALTASVTLKLNGKPALA